MFRPSKYWWGVLICTSQVHAQYVGGRELCAKSENRAFSCLTQKAKSISLCGTETAGLQYRYGRPGKIELSYPEQVADSKDKFSFAHYSRFQTERVEVSFKNQNINYTLFDYVENGRREAGIRVAAENGNEVSIQCRGKIQGKLLDLKSDLPCDKDSALNGGRCN